MATRKGTTKAKATTKRAPTTGAVPPYGPPIRDAIARGDLQEMRAVANSARKWIRDVEAALKKLDDRIAKVSSK